MPCVQNAARLAAGRADETSYRNRCATGHEQTAQSRRKRLHVAAFTAVRVARPAARSPLDDPVRWCTFVSVDAILDGAGSGEMEHAAVGQRNKTISRRETCGSAYGVLRAAGARRRNDNCGGAKVYVSQVRNGAH